MEGKAETSFLFQRNNTLKGHTGYPNIALILMSDIF